MAPVEENDRLLNKRSASAVVPEPDVFAALNPRGVSPVNKKGRTRSDGECASCNVSYEFA